MPAPIQSSWADEVEEDNLTVALPPQSEKISGDTKIVTEYTVNEDGKKVKHVRTYKIEKKLVPAVFARRKMWEKFGKSRDDGEGPHAGTTLVAEEVNMQFVANKEEGEKDEQEKSLGEILKSKNKSMVKCRYCKEDHWSQNCPYKDTLEPLRESLASKDKDEDAEDTKAAAGSSGKYIPPSRREGSSAKERLNESMNDRRRPDDTAAIRVSNLSESAQESDLQELFKQFGSIQRIFLAKDKITGQCKGFAFINFIRKEDAAKAIATVDGFGYDHLILKVEWAKPSGT